MCAAARLPFPRLSRGRFSFPLVPSIMQAEAPGSRGVLHALTDEDLFSKTGVRIAFTERFAQCIPGEQPVMQHVDNDVASCGEAPEAPFELDAKSEVGSCCIAEAFGAPRERVLVPNQVHGVGVIAPESEGAKAFIDAQARADQGADAVVLPYPGYAALLYMADCLPLILVAPDGMVAVVHCGWRGAVQGLAGKALEALVQRSGQPAQACNAYIGPCIHPECFEVSEEVAQRFADAFGPECVRAERYVDLPAAVRIDLIGKGMAIERIADAGVCTACNTHRFYSYRAEDGEYGRHGAFAFRAEKRSSEIDYS